MKKTLLSFAAVLATAFFITGAHAQMPEKGAKNTMTLPNGEVIWDLNGDWELLVERYGPAKSEYGNYHRDPFIRITQEGKAFSAIRSKGDFWYKAGTETARGKLNKGGFGEVQIIWHSALLDAKGQISEDGNKIVIDDGEKVKHTYTRK